MLLCYFLYNKQQYCLTKIVEVDILEVLVFVKVRL